MFIIFLSRQAVAFVCFSGHHLFILGFNSLRCLLFLITRIHLEVAFETVEYICQMMF